jgi:D-3-phosphoglycerate dehydrogenase
MDVLIADTLEPEVLEWLSARHDVKGGPDLAQRPGEFTRLLATARTAIVPAHLALDGSTLRSATQLRAIGRLSPAVDRIDLPMCAARGIEIVRPTHASMLAEAEFAVGALLQMLRRVPVLSPDGLLVGRELNNCRVGIIGMAGAAKPLADLLRAFGSRVVGYDPGQHATDPQWVRVGIAPTGLRELFAECDAVVVLLNYFSRYRGLLGERFFLNAKRDQVLVNLSSAFILDEDAFAEALQSGRMAAAWLDSVEPGMLAAGRPLSNLDSLQVTPRVASSTLESHLRASWDVVRRLDEILSEGAAGGPFSWPPPGAPIGRSAGPPPG